MSCSGSGLPNLAKIHGLHVKDASEYFHLLKEKDEKAILVKNEFLKILTQFFSFVQQTYQPDIFIVTGGVLKSKHFWFEEFLNMNKDKVIKQSEFDQLAGLIGSACYGFHRS